MININKFSSKLPTINTPPRTYICIYVKVGQNYTGYNDYYVGPL